MNIVQNGAIGVIQFHIIANTGGGPETNHGFGVQPFFIDDGGEHFFSIFEQVRGGFTDNLVR